MSRVIHCLGGRALTSLRSYLVLTPTASRGILDRHVYSIPTSRNIFTANAIGIEKLDQLRSQKMQLFAGEARERYVDRLRSFTEMGNCKSIYKEDLVNMLGIAESDQDLDLLEKILESSTPEQRDFFSGWGATAMRLYYKMGQLDRAVKNIEDKQRFGEFFNMRTCYQIVMTMLYDQGQYKKMFDLFQIAVERLKDTYAAKNFHNRTGEELLPDRILTILAFVALAKIRTPEALQEAKKLLSNYINKGKNVGLRPLSLVAYLALSNGDEKYALNLVSSAPTKNYVSLRDTKIVALIQLERFDDVLLQIREYAADSKFTQNQMLKSTFEELQKAEDKIKDAVLRQDLGDLLVEIANNNHVSEDTLDTLIFRPIDYDSDRFRSDRQNFSRDSMDRQSTRRDRYSDNNDYGSRRDDNSYRSRGGERHNESGGHRSERRFSFKNVNFEA